MVIVQHPTSPNPNEPSRYSRTTGFGRGKSRGSGYLAYSDRIGPGVLVLHEFFGLTPSFRDYCDRLCDEGFTALAPDLYDGAIAEDVEGAEALRDSLDVETVMARLRAAAEHLTSNWHPRLGVVGFSLGAWYASKLARELPAEAAVLYYGVPDDDPGTWTGPLQGHYASDDEWEPLDRVRATLIALEDRGVEVDAHVYEGTGHWFANADVPEHFNEPAAALAWSRTIDFLRHHLA